HVEYDPLPPATGWAHLDHLAAPFGNFLDDHAAVLLVDVDDHLLDRLEPLACLRIGLVDDLRPRHRQLEALPAHGLNQNRELQLTTARHLERVLLLGLCHTDSDVPLGLAEKPFTDR